MRRRPKGEEAHGAKRATGYRGAVPAGLRIEHLTSFDELEELAPEWNGFLKRCVTDSIFLTWEYLSTWWECFGDDYDLHVLVARGGAGELLGIAPLITGAGDGRGRRRLRHLAFMGALGESCGEREDFMVLEGHEDEVIRGFGGAIFGELESAWDVILMAMVPTESRCLAAWRDELMRYGAVAFELRRYQAYYRPLPETWEEYLAGRSAHFRSNFKRKWKKLAEEKEVQLLTVGEDCTVEEAFAALVELNRERWGDEGQAFLTEKFNRFHRRLAQTLHGKGLSRMSVIEVDGKAAAVCYGFAYDRKFSVLQYGWDPAYARQSIGLLALGLGQKGAIETGLRELDLMSGEDEYKKMWATESRELVDVEIANPRSLRALGFQRLRSLKNLVLPS